MRRETVLILSPLAWALVAFGSYRIGLIGETTTCLLLLPSCFMNLLAVAATGDGSLEG